MDGTTIITLLVSSTITGAGIGFGFWFVSRNFLRDLTKKIPEYIHEVMQESRKNQIIENAVNSRGKYGTI